MPAAKPFHPKYAVHPGVKMVRDWIDSLSEKTGKSMDQWMAFIKKHGPATQAERTAWLKSGHKLGSNTAAWLAERSLGKGFEEDSPEGYLAQARVYVDAMYAGKKAHLRPLHDDLVRMGLALGKDVEICPGKTIVPFYRTHVFAQLKPATNTRIDLGLCFTPLMKAGEKLPAGSGILVDTGGFAKNDRITHRIPITTSADITPEVNALFRRAYDLAK